MAAFNQVAAVGGKVLTGWMADGDPGIDFFAHPTGRILALGYAPADVATSNGVEARRWPRGSPRSSAPVPDRERPRRRPRT